MFARKILLLSVLLAALIPSPALAAAHTPSITGNAWVAIALLLGLIGLIVLTVVVSVGLQRRDRARGTRDDSGFGLFGGDD
jgi:hypothetical protein